MSGRYDLPSDDKKPGPGSYSPEKMHIDIPPAHSFGIKHSPYIGNLRDRNMIVLYKDIQNENVSVQNNLNLQNSMNVQNKFTSIQNGNVSVQNSTNVQNRNSNNVQSKTTTSSSQSQCGNTSTTKYRVVTTTQRVSQSVA